MTIATRDENPMGFHTRYVVSKLDGSPVNETAEYFVLRLDNDGDEHHVAACRAAVLEYAKQIAPHLPNLAADLRDKYGESHSGWSTAEE